MTYDLTGVHSDALECTFIEVLEERPECCVRYRVRFDDGREGYYNVSEAQRKRHLELAHA